MKSRFLIARSCPFHAVINTNIDQITRSHWIVYSQLTQVNAIFIINAERIWSINAWMAMMFRFYCMDRLDPANHSLYLVKIIKTMVSYTDVVRICCIDYRRNQKRKMQRIGSAK